MANTFKGSPFKDAVSTKVPKSYKPTLGNDPCAKVTGSDVSGSVKPKALPENTLKFGK